MPENHVTTYEDLLANDEAAIADHCRQMEEDERTERRYGHYPEAQGWRQH